MKHNRQLMAKGLQLDIWGQSKSFLLQLCSVLDTEVTTLTIYRLVAEIKDVFSLVLVTSYDGCRLSGTCCTVGTSS